MVERWSRTGRPGRIPLVAAALILLLATAFLAACRKEAEPLVYTEADSGTSVTAATGDVITVRLVENPSTGYAWAFELSAGLEEHENEFLQANVSPGVVGAAGTRELSVTATKPGTQSVRGTYARSWGDPAETAGKFTLTIEVGE